MIDHEIVEDHGINNEQALANALMYCKIIRDYFTQIKETPVFFKFDNSRKQEDISMLPVSARFSNLHEEPAHELPVQILQ